MQRDRSAEREYRNRLQALSSQLERYRTAATALSGWAGATDETAAAFFRAADGLAETLNRALVESDPEAAEVALGMIGIDFAIADLAAALAVATREVSAELGRDGQSFLEQPLIDHVQLQVEVAAPELTDGGPIATGGGL